MAVKIFISAPRGKRTFIDCVNSVAQERGDRTIYPPDEFRDLRDRQLLEKAMREVRTSHLVLMDVSMENLGEKWYPNSGVMIEFGLVMNDPTKGIECVYMFCDQDTERDHLPPMIPRVEVTQYSENNEDELKGFIRTALQEYGEAVPERLRQALLVKHATEILALSRLSETTYTE